jgi:hypothetical protein
MTVVLGPIHATIMPFKVSAVLSRTQSRNVLLDTRSYRKCYMLPCCEAILRPSATGCQCPCRCRDTWENSFFVSPRSEARPYWYSGNIRHSTRRRWYVEITDFICLTISQPKPRNAAQHSQRQQNQLPRWRCLLCVVPQRSEKNSFACKLYHIGSVIHKSKHKFGGGK